MVDLNHIDITLNINGLNTPWDKEHSTREIRKSFELNENEITFHIYISQWDKTKTVIWGKYIVLSDH